MTSDLLRPGQVVFATYSKIPCLITGFLGSGGQGEVYRAELHDDIVAVKWYRPAIAGPRQYRALEDLVRRNPPSSAFLWPLDIVTASRSTSFGYVMPIRDQRFAGMGELVRRNVDPTARVLATIGFGLAEAFLSLHAQGLCYRDISFGNVFFDPETGEVLVCDNDNVTIDGTTPGGILGTPRFMAPEVVRGVALPSSRTDLFSLAVLLFNMFFIHHPFEGAGEQRYKVLDVAAMRELYGEHPVFIFDPDNDSNRPISGTHQNALDLWSYFPRDLRDLFVRSFTRGVTDPINGRVRESEWRQAMVRLRDSVLLCDSCGGDAESFWEPSEPWKGVSCWRCKASLPAPVYLAFETARSSETSLFAVASPGAKIYPHHVEAGALYDFSRNIGEVVRHPSNRALLGVRNTSVSTWRATGARGTVREVEPGMTVGLSPRTTIDFGTSTAEVRQAT
ncbi:MAG: serine/threonine protein kinase [Actinobacteria bacterium]|nr:serine/threonine protein kinase [Actinomycetota bacterium]MCL5446660.1 serine/threonine protein kinase [Actinomycetota bacterium]